MNTRELLDIVYSFFAGFGTRETRDKHNALFIAKELFNLDLQLEFKGMGRCGVESIELYGVWKNVKPYQKKSEAFNAGKMLSHYNSRELVLMASYLWNEGRSSLREEEIEEARILLEKWETASEQSTEPSAVASG
ncbi:MAG: hypothetical protein HXS48_23835 [Theionarchaea archaeon]|nr:MAG: hypothetical protein AYK19_21495 [Theionarchaea archaeon DG-70-1]MBU7029983.1 hypothetical protein [Theionarchaea archaeon]